LAGWTAHYDIESFLNFAKAEFDYEFLRFKPRNVSRATVKRVTAMKVQ
jgi:hypothetical protein